MRREDPLNASELERVNDELRHSLEHCQELLAECRSKLAANSNEEVAEERPEDKARLA